MLLHILMNSYTSDSTRLKRDCEAVSNAICQVLNDCTELVKVLAVLKVVS